MNGLEIAKHRRTLSFAALIGLGSLSLADRGYGRDVASLDEIQGMWRQISAELSGRPMIDRPFTFEVVGDTYTEIETNTISSNLVIDSTKSPATYEESVNYYRPNAFTRSGILKVSGDQLFLAHRPPNSERPSTFESTPGDRINLETWERDGEFVPPDLPIARQLEGKWRLTSRVNDGRSQDLSVVTFRMQISGTMVVRTDSTMKRGRIILEPGSNRLILDQSNPPAKMAGLIDYDPEEKTLKIIVDIRKESKYPPGFVTRPGVLERLRVFKRDDAVKDTRPR